jgi:hypothetical protein
MTNTPPADSVSSLAPELADDDQVRFVESHRPKLLDGDYELTVTHQLEVEQTVEAGWPTFASSTSNDDRTSESKASFTVTGPRFSIPPTLVHTAFPPPGSRGRFGHVLAHVVLERTTLPWERSAVHDPRRRETPNPIAETSSEEPLPELPWLALVVFEAADLVGRKKNLTVSELLATNSGTNSGGPGSDVLTAPLSGEMSDDPEAGVQVLDLPWSVLEPAVPTVAELSWLCHVRDVVPADHTDDNNTGPIVESATVISPHRPKVGHRNEAHLISVEGWYQLNRRGRLEPSFAPTASDDVRVVSLFSWEFVCEADAARSFSDLANDLGRTVDRLRRPSGVETGAAQPWLQNGYTVLPHQFRNGEESLSWYHGPLRPGQPSFQIHRSTESKLPALRADELTVFDSTSGIYDVSYAAAWELGRLLALQHPSVGIKYQQWRTSHRHAAHRRWVLSEHDHLLHGAKPPPAPEFPLRDWFRSAIDQLGAVPFRYLVPDEEMLPVESLRFFEVDQRWMACLRDGALSIGRTGGGEGAQADERELLEGTLPPLQPMQGILLRSQMVVDYPGLMIDAFSSHVPHPKPTDGTEPSPLAPVRIDHLSPQVLVAMYPAVVEEVHLHLHPQAMHFQLADEDAGPGDDAGHDDIGAAIDRLGPRDSADLALKILAHTPRRRYRRWL